MPVPMGLLPLHVHLKRWHSFCLVHKICVPVTVTPFAQAGITTTKCCGDPVVTPGREVCAGVKNGSCFLTITQDICADCGKIPLLPELEKTEA